MSIKDVGDALERFLIDPKPGVFVIRGQWGVGKTYFWRSQVFAHKSEASRKRYSYVSLFGMPSIQQLQLATFVNADDIENVPDPDPVKAGVATQARSIPGFKELSMKLSAFLPGEWGRRVSLALESMAPHLVRDLLICFDDFERLPAQGPQFEEILGFIATLKEQKNCKVVLIFNDQELNEGRDVYMRYREKVVDVEAAFAPTAAEAVGVVLKKELLHANIIRERVIRLDISNMRLIQRIRANVELVSPLIADAHESIIQIIVAMVVLLTWIEYDPTGQHPSLEFVRKWNSMSFLMGRAKKGEKAEDEDKEMQKWSEILQSYGVISFDSCDEAIATVVSRGYIAGSGLEDEVAKLKVNTDAALAEEEFTRGWRLVHDSLDDDEDKIVQIFDGTFDRAAPRLTPSNLDATVRLLRNLDRDKLADALIDRYIRIRGSEEVLFDPEEGQLGGAIEDEQVKQRFKDQYQRIHRPPPLDLTLASIAQGRGWSVEQIAVLSAASADDLFSTFKSAGDAFSSMAKRCLEFANDPERRHISENAKVALKRLAGESRINRWRILNKFGISADQPTAANARDVS